MKAVTLMICEDGITHFPGGGIADTSTLCGFGPGAATETSNRIITCAACAELIREVKAAQVKLSAKFRK